MHKLTEKSIFSSNSLQEITSGVFGVNFFQIALHIFKIKQGASQSSLIKNLDLVFLSSASELIQNGRLLTLPLVAGDLQSLLPDEDGRRLYVAMKDNLLSTSLDDITQNPRKVRAVGQTHSLTYQTYSRQVDC